MRKYTAAPHPFILELPWEPESEIAQLGLTLVGRANVYLPYVIHAFQRAGEQGLGKGRALMTLIDVRQAEPTEADRWILVYETGGTLSPKPPAAPAVPAPPSSIRLRIRTPLRLQRDGSLITPRTFRFSDLFGALLRRVSMLTYFHTDTPLETDFSGLTHPSRQVELADAKLFWRDWTRYSSRQKNTMQMGGVVGEIAIGLAGRSALWPYLWLGQWVRAGKGTSMGLGHYTIESASLPDPKSPPDNPTMAP